MRRALGPGEKDAGWGDGIANPRHGANSYCWTASYLYGGGAIDRCDDYLSTFLPQGFGDQTQGHYDNLPKIFGASTGGGNHYDMADVDAFVRDGTGSEPYCTWSGEAPVSKHFYCNTFQWA